MIVYGDQNVEYPDNITFGQYMLEQMKLQPGNNVCLENGLTGETMTTKEFTQYMVNLSVSLSELGVEKGDVVAIGSENFLRYVPTTLAIISIGAVSTYYEIEILEAELKHKLQQAKPKYFIFSSQFWQDHQHVLKSFDFIESYIAVSDLTGMKYSLESLTAENVDIGRFVPINIQGKNDVAFIFYSSGTTGMPKGIEVTHYSSIARCDLGLHRDKTPLQRTLFVSSYGAFGAFAICRCLKMSGRIIMTADSCTDMLLRNIQKSKPGVILTYPTRIRDMLNSATRKDHLNSVKTIICGAFPLRGSTIQMFKDRLPHVEDVRQTYGATECGIITTDLSVATAKPGSVGVAAPGMIIKIVDLDTEANLGQNQNGEIRVKGPTLMKGYINRSSFMDDDGYYKTRDIGYFDEDKYLYVIGRIKDTICNKFGKVSPVDVEDILLEHPAVIDAAVVSKPDPDLNEVAAGFVVKRPGCDVTESELVEFVASKVSPAMLLKGGVRFISEIPKNEDGKVIRRKLQLMLNENVK